MKFLFVLLIGFSCLPSFADQDAAIAYNDKIVSEQNKIGEKILVFSADPTDETLLGIKKQAKESLAILKTMKAFENNSDLLEAAKGLFKLYLDIAENEYKQLLGLLKNKNKYTQDELVARINEYGSAIDVKEKPLDAKFQAAQNAFSKKYGFTLKENELQDELNGAAGKDN